MKTLPAGLGAQFAISGKPIGLRPHGRGHIHETFLLKTDSGSQYIFQKINQRIFPDALALQKNILRVTAHIAEKQKQKHPEDWTRRVLQPVPTLDGVWMHTTAAGDAWRAFVYISGTRTIDLVSEPAEAYELGRAFGQFQRMLADFPGTLHETIPDFHNTPARFTAFQEAVRNATADRLQSAREEIRTAEARAEMAGRLIELRKAGTLPLSIAHNDTKINNLLFDTDTGEALCAIDLDTVMPGLSLYDFGDMVRTGTPTMPEEASDLRGIQVDLDRFAALAQGYLAAAGALLIEAERRELVFSGRLLTYETGLRFLTDYLTGDNYFRTTYPGQNLDRCRNQFRLLADMEQKASEMEEIAAAVWERLIS